MSGTDEEEDEMRDEYDFSNGVRGKYVHLVAAAGLIRLEPDVAKVFTTSEAVNTTLRGLLPVINAQAEKLQHNSLHYRTKPQN